MIDDVKPEVKSRVCGGWLAVSPLGASLRIGVTGESEEIAVERFTRAYKRCQSLLLTDGEASPNA